MEIIRLNIPQSNTVVTVDVPDSNNVVAKQYSRTNTLVNTIYEPVHTQTVRSDSTPTTVYLKTGLYDPSIERILNRIEEMRVLVMPQRIRSEFDLFLQYAQAKTDGATDAEFDSFDDYLGSIGV